MPGPNTKLGVFALYNMDVGEDECWVWKGAFGGRDRTRRPYYQFNRQRMIAYRCVYELVNGVKLTSDQLIRHTCDKGGEPTGCGNPKHLLLGNNTQNMADMKERERHGLPRSVVKAIRRLLDQGRSQESIAELYGVSQTNISAIHLRRTYSHIEAEDYSEELEPIKEDRNGEA